ncbi:hypothetical protein ACIOKD_41670 [Streptomyces sp. NPDC087844]|uniref:hypothetical protein n=1 Tax=Streptomyces sp. NPDC087844 TaxID=3365805 RepID=UPI00382A43DC
MIIASASYEIRQIFRGGCEPADTAGVLGLLLGGAGLAAAIVALRKPVDGNGLERARALAAALALQVTQRESAV